MKEFSTAVLVVLIWLSCTATGERVMKLVDAKVKNCQDLKK